MIQKLAVFMFPLLLGSTNLELAQNNINTRNRDYEVIEATTGKKTDNIESYAEDRVIETHITAVSAIKKALANEGIDPAIVRVLLYYDSLFIDDSLPSRMWQTQPHPDTISSPWLDLTRTVTNSGETRIIIRIDATSSRLLSDLYSESADKSNISGFLEIPAIRQSCFSKIMDAHTTAFIKIVYQRQEGSVFDEVGKSYNCAPKKLREPLISLMRESHGFGFGGLPVSYNSLRNLNYYCQDEAEQYYSQLYPRLAIRGLQILESKLNSEPKWWTEIIDQIEPIQECQR